MRAAALTAAAAFAAGLFLAGCSNPAGGGGFVPVTDINGPSIAFKDQPLTLTGSVEPSNATNRTIVWSDTGGKVANGVFTAGTGAYTVTAVIEDGVSEGISFTKDFVITVYDPGNGSGSNPFGGASDADLFIWAMDDKGGLVYVIIRGGSAGGTWKAVDQGTPYNEGTYTRVGSTGAGWTVTGGSHLGNTGMAVIESGKMKVGNLTYEFSPMNGTFTKLDRDLSLGANTTWKGPSSDMDGGLAYMKIVTGGSGDFTASFGPDNFSWSELLHGRYGLSQIEGKPNPVVCTIDEVDIAMFGYGLSSDWKPWNQLTPQQKNMLGGSQEFSALLYSATECQTLSYVLTKE
jgi:hypothetical protein